MNFKLFNKHEDIVTELDKSEVKPIWIFYNTRGIGKSLGWENAFNYFSPVLLVFNEDKLIGGAHIDKNNNDELVVFGLEGGRRITDQFTETELNEIKTHLCYE